jgi:prepilin-type processing-associated H-X9-DG protein
MTMSRDRLCQIGFSRTELLVALVVIVMLTAVGFLYVKNVKPRGAYMSCKYKLSATYPVLVSSGMINNQELKRFQLPLPARIFQSLSNESIIPYYFLCPTDSRQYATNWQQLANTNLSYFLSLSSSEQSPATWVLAGDRHISPRGDMTLDTSTNGFAAKWNSQLGLHPPRDRKERGLSVPYGNILFGDGHVEMLDDAGLAKAIRNSIGGTNLWAIP